MVQAGDIFYTSWGYEQTNVEFYQVIRATEKTVWVREISGANSGDWWSGHTEPAKDSFISEKILRRKLKGGDSPFFSVNAVADAWPYEGQKLYYSNYA